MTPNALSGTVDRVDIRILNALLADGRASFRAISDQVGVAVTTVSGRLEKLEHRGVIQGYGPRIDYAKLGYETGAVFQIQVAGGALDPTIRRLQSIQTVTSVLTVTGEFDVLAVGRFVDTDGVNACIRELARAEEIERVTTNVVLSAPTDGRPFALPLE